MPGYRGQLSDELGNYEALGLHQGRQNLPPTETQALDQHEAALEAKATRAAIAVQAELEQKTQKIDVALTTLVHELHDVRIKYDTQVEDGSPAEYTAQFLASEKQPIVALRRKAAALQADLERFKKLHSVERTATYPPDRILHLSKIFLCIALETIANAFFFQNENGLLGGAVIALALSAVNVGLACILGHLFTYKNRTNILVTTAGHLSILFCVAASTYINALFSAFRHQFQLLADPSSFEQNSEAFKISIAKAIGIFYLHIPFDDVTSFALFFVGCMISAYAFYKGYTIDDPLPGYGPVSRRYAAALQEALNAEGALRSRLSDRLGAARTELLRLKSSLNAHAATIANLERTLKSAQNEFATDLPRIQAEFELVLSAYRKANSSVRKIPSPRHFEAFPTILRNIGDNVTPSLATAITHEKMEVEHFRTEVLPNLNKRIESLTQVSANILGTQMNAFLRDVQLLAEEEMVSPRSSSDE